MALRRPSPRQVLRRHPRSSGGPRVAGGGRGERDATAGVISPSHGNSGARARRHRHSGRRRDDLSDSPRTNARGLRRLRPRPARAQDGGSSASQSPRDRRDGMGRGQRRHAPRGSGGGTRGRACRRRRRVEGRLRGLCTAACQDRGTVGPGMWARSQRRRSRRSGKRRWDHRSARGDARRGPCGRRLAGSVGAAVHRAGQCDLRVAAARTTPDSRRPRMRPSPQLPQTGR